MRDPSVHWGGTKALFSMVVGAPAQQNDDDGEYYWQIYEISGLGQSQTPVITKVPRQPASFNNISPIYGTDDRIIFTSDRPRNGAATSTRSSTSMSWRRPTPACGASTQPAATCLCSTTRHLAISPRSSTALAG